MVDTVEIYKYLTDSDIAKAEEAEYDYTQKVGPFYMMDLAEVYAANEIYWESIRSTLNSKGIELGFTIYSNTNGAEETVYDFEEAATIAKHYIMDNPGVEYTISATPLFYK